MVRIQTSWHEQSQVEYIQHTNVPLNHCQPILKIQFQYYTNIDLRQQINSNKKYDSCNDKKN